MTEDIEKGPLEGDEAIKLWLKKKDKWNEEIDKYSSVDFSGENFSEYKRVSFEGFKFPNGGVSFKQARFGVGDFSFTNATFGDGDVDFSGATFEDGDVSFVEARFGDSDVSFQGVELGGGNVSFSHKSSWTVRFNCKGVVFNGGCFVLVDDAAKELWQKGRDEWNKWVKDHLNWGIDFNDVDFSKYEEISFARYKFPDCRVSFNRAKFGDSKVSFVGSKFLGDIVTFMGTDFGDSNVSFEGAELGNGHVFFNHKSFWTAKFNFNDVIFNGGCFLLSGDAAKELWQKGQGEWNKWVKDHSGWGIDLYDVDFSKYEEISFENYKFPNRIVSFVRAKFGDSNVSFEDAKFGDGGVYFDRANFGDGYVSFLRAKFGDGNVSFEDAKFGDGHVSFEDTKFGNSTVSFERTKFGDSNVSFAGAEFGNSNFLFRHTEFENGDIKFDYAKCDGLFDFSPKKAEAIKRLSFFACTFKGVMLLRGKFSCTPDLRSAYLTTNLDLENLTIEYKRLTEKQLTEDAARLAKDQWIENRLKEWEQSSIENGLKKWEQSSKEKLGKNQLTVYKSNLSENLLDNSKERQREKLKKQWGLNKNDKLIGEKLTELISKQNIETPAYFRRLKELAEKNRDHDKALYFFAEECSADRENQNKARAWLDKAYAGSCRHGRSIRRPFGWLVGSWLVFSEFYCLMIIMRNKDCGSLSQDIHWEALFAYPKSFLFCIFNSVPFLGFTRHGYNNIFCKFLGSEPSFWVYIPIGLQSLIAFIFLFLIGLGIRNRFRI